MRNKLGKLCCPDSGLIILLQCGWHFWSISLGPNFHLECCLHHISKQILFSSSSSLKTFDKSKTFQKNLTWPKFPSGVLPSPHFKTNSLLLFLFMTSFDKQRHIQRISVGPNFHPECFMLRLNACLNFSVSFAGLFC